MEWKKLLDKTLGTNFDAPVYDPQKGRDKLIHQIDLAAKQHSDGSTRAPNRAWKAGGQNAIRFIPTLNGNPIMLDDGKPAYVPAEHFQDFLGKLKKSVNAGDLDKEIKTALETKGGVNAGGGKTSTPRKRSATGDDQNHPKFTDPKWSTYTPGEKIQKGLAYKRENA